VNFFVFSSMTKTAAERVETLIRRLGRAHRPTTLYHYTSGAGLLGILESQAIWASNIRYLNDAREYELAVDLARRIIEGRERAATSKFDAALLAVLKDSLGGTPDPEVYVVSFTENGDQLSQWRGYTPADAGYSVGFAARQLATRDPSSAGAFLVRCVYDPDEHRKLISQVISHSLEHAMALHDSQRDNRDRVFREAYKIFARFMPLVVPALKDSNFKEEEEWRLVALASSFSAGAPEFRAAGSLIVPYHLVSLTSPAAILPISEIIVGPNPNPSLAKLSIEHLLVKYGLGSATVVTSGIPYRTW
jgi:hypothetical protein